MARRVAADVYLLETAWPEPIGSNAYLLDDGDVTLVDAGLPIPRRPLAAELRDAGYRPAALDRVLLTHYDIDHVGGLSGLGDALDVPIYIGAADARLVRRSWSPPWRHHKGLFHRLVRRWYSLSSADLYPVEDGDRIGRFRALHTPGHNPGHTVFLHEALETALLGDLVWESGGQFRSPPWLDSYDTGRMTDSILRVARESFEHACVGHGDPISPGGDEALRQLAAEL
jgi:glyoxylase-like metal-dependent hydrolase (beta-lactamase superfamily II)